MTGKARDTTPLFRPEAARYRGSRLGRVSIALPLSSWLLTLFLCGVIIALGTFLSVGRYAQKETVRGYVTPSAGAADVFPGRQGIIDRVYVTLGDRVSAGDPLFSVSDHAELPHGGEVSDEIRARLESQIAHLAAERAGTTTLFQRRIARLRHTTATTRQALAQSAQQLALVRERHTLAEASAAARSTLAHAQALSLDQLRQARADVLTARLDVERAAQRHRELESRLPAVRLEQQETAAELDRQIAVLDSRLEQLRAQLVEWQARQALVMVAPVDGTVAFSQISPGQTASPQSPAMTIVPSGAALEIRLLIPSRAKGFIEPGQTVRLKFDAFPHQQFGTRTGTVRQVSAAAVAGRHLLAPVAIQEPVYLAIVRLDIDRIQAYGRPYAIQPGMTLSADVILGDQRLIAWAMEPLLRLRG